jgi:hypothetical protein
MGLFKHPASEYYEQRILELLIDREVLKNMLVFSGVSMEVIVASMREAKADTELWEMARKHYALHFVPAQLTNGSSATHRVSASVKSVIAFLALLSVRCISGLWFSGEMFSRISRASRSRVSSTRV